MNDCAFIHNQEYNKEKRLNDKRGEKAMQLMITLMVLGCAVILFMNSRMRPDLVAITALLVLVLTGVLTTTEALAGFSNQVVIMIAGLFIVGAGIFRTGLAQMGANMMVRFSGNSEKRLYVLLLVIVACIGAFLSNTGTVALMLPIVVSVALSIGKNPTKYLMPLSFIASMSGLLTLIASPPNLIVSQLLTDNDFGKLKFFDITPIGIIAVIACIIYLFFVQDKLIPDRQSRNVKNDEYTLSLPRLAMDYQLGKKQYKVTVAKDSPIIGKTLSSLQLSGEYNILIVSIQRTSGEGVQLLHGKTTQLGDANTVIDANDQLFIQGDKNDVERFITDYSLILKEKTARMESLLTKQLGFAEVLLTPHSSFIQQTIASIGFREKYNVTILGIYRQGEYLSKNMTNERLRFGDALLVHGNWEDIDLLTQEMNDVVVIGKPKELAGMAAASGKAWVAGMIMLFMVGLMILEIFPAVICVLIGAALMIVTGCVRNIEYAYQQINWESIILIAAMLPMATALEKTGGMTMISDVLIQSLSPFGAFGVLCGIYLMTMIFGQFISNTATAVLFAPIALNAAIAIDASPYPFMIAVAAAASMSFATPVASPTNALVLSSGGYTFMDFVKVGVPLQVFMFVVMMGTIPLFFPL